MTNWVTTLLGWIGGLPIGIQAIITAYKAGQLNLNNIPELILAISVILIGVYAKDKQPVGIALRNPFVKTLLPAADGIVTLESTEHPDSVALADMKKILDALLLAQQNLQAQQTASPTPAPAASAV